MGGAIYVDGPEEPPTARTFPVQVTASRSRCRLSFRHESATGHVWRKWGDNELPTSPATGDGVPVRWWVLLSMCCDPSILPDIDCGAKKRNQAQGAHPMQRVRSSYNV